MASSPHAIIQRLMAALGLQTQAQLSASLGIRPQSIISAIKRGEIPDAWLYRVAYATGRSVEWLRTGGGPAWQADAVSETREPLYGTREAAGGAFQEIFADWRELDDEERATVQRCVEALRIGDRDIREHLIGQMKLVEEAIQRRRSRKRRQRRRLLP